MVRKLCQVCDFDGVGAKKFLTRLNFLTSRNFFLTSRNFFLTRPSWDPLAIPRLSFEQPVAEPSLAEQRASLVGGGQGMPNSHPTQPKKANNLTLIFIN